MTNFLTENRAICYLVNLVSLLLMPREYMHDELLCNQFRIEGEV